MHMSCLPVQALCLRENAGARRSRWSVDVAGAHAAEAGLDGADVSVMHLADHTPAMLAAVRRQAEECGLRIAMLVAYSDFTQTDAKARQRQTLERHIATAAALGAPFCASPQGRRTPA